MSKRISDILNRYNIAIVVIAIFFIADRWLKLLALEQKARPAQKLIGESLLFDFHSNYNIAFSLPLSGWPITALIILIILALIYTIFYLILKRKDQKWLILLLTFILFGAISNILDRFLYGYVIDYLALQYFAVFNLADVMISAGTVFLIITNFQKKKYAECLKD